MHNDSTQPFRSPVDEYSLDEVVAALRAVLMSDKARAMLVAMARAPSRALSRYEMALAAGSTSHNAANSALGSFAKRFLLTLDSRASEIKDNGGDYVMQVFMQLPRLREPVHGEPDWWVFVMPERLAEAFAELGYAPYEPFSEEAAEFWLRYILERDGDTAEGDDDDEGGDDVIQVYEDPFDDISQAEESGEFDELTDTDRDAVVRARVGQGKFRDALLREWDGECAVTGVSTREVLVASHIKPWATCTNEERLDPANGLLLIGTLDRLFDNYLISFDAAGVIMLSPQIPPEEYERMHISAKLRLRKIPKGTEFYLKEHREQWFAGESTESHVTH